MEKIVENITNYSNNILDNLQQELKKDKDTVTTKIKELSSDFNEIVETYNSEGFLKAAVTTLDVTLENLLKFGLDWRIGTSIVDIKEAFQKNGLAEGVEQIITEGVQQLVYTSKDITSAISSALKIRNAFKEDGIKEGLKVAFKEGLGEVLDNNLVSSTYKTAVQTLKDAYNSVKDWITSKDKSIEEMNWQELKEYWNEKYKGGDLEEMTKSAELLQNTLPKVTNQKNKNQILEIMMNQKLIEAKVDWWTARLQNDQKGMEIAASQGILCRKAGATITMEEVTFIDVAYRQILNSIKDSYTQDIIPLSKNNEEIQYNMDLLSENSKINVNINDINKQVSTNFKISDFLSEQTIENLKNNGNIEIYLNKNLVDKLEKLRLELTNIYTNQQIDIQINSGYRTSEDNELLNNAHKANHSEGKAVDITVWREDDGLTNLVSSEEIAKIAKEIGFTGIGTYENFVHLDIREKSYNWKR